MWLSLGLRLLGLTRWLKEALGTLVGYPLQAAIIALLCLSGWQTWRVSVVKQSLATARAELVSQRYKFGQAQKQAEARQKAADQSNIAGQLAAIRQQDAAHDQLEAARRSAVSEFRTAGRVRFEAACRSPSGASDAGVPDNPRPPAGGQADSDFVAIRPEDIEALSQTELQNAERGQFLRGLVSQGLAVPQSVLPEAAFGP